jgi:serine/threonine protein kinase
MLSGGKVALKVHKHELDEELREELNVQAMVDKRAGMHAQDMKDRGWLCGQFSSSCPVIRLLEYFFQRGPCGLHGCFVLEVAGPSLHGLSKAHGRLPPSTVRKITAHTLFGLDCLHRFCNLVHGDLKPENVLASWPATVSVAYRTIEHPDICFKIADFGLARAAGAGCTGVVCSLQYRAPEVVRGCCYGTPVDVWSMGCMLFELATGRFLFDLAPSDDVLRSPRHLAQIRDFSDSLFVQGSLMRTHGSSAAPYASLLKAMMREEPSQRQTALNLLLNTDAPGGRLFISPASGLGL